MKLLLLGGSKSGKSRFAQQIVRDFGPPMIYWATMEPTDAEDRRRIENHLLDRAGWGFETIECGRELPQAFDRLPPNASVLLDSVTALLANEMFAGTFDEAAGERVLAQLSALAAQTKNLVCVCDELWRDGRVYSAAVECYRRELAMICRALAARFDAVCEVSAGVPRFQRGAF